MFHPDLDELLNSCIKFAKEMLGKNKEFYPFGASIDSNGERKLNAVYDGEEYPDSNVLLVLLEKEYESEADNLKAAAVCSNVHITLPKSNDETDSILVSLEHENGESVDVYLPYKIKLDSVSFGELFSNSRKRVFFTS